MKWGRRRQWTASSDYNGLTRGEFQQLADYNGEKARGIVHAPEFVKRMAALQERWNAGQREEFARRGITVIDS